MSTLAENLRGSLQRSIETHTGILGDVLREKRLEKERGKERTDQLEKIEENTKRIRVSATTIIKIQKGLQQTAANLRSIAVALGAQLTLQEETNAALKTETKPTSLSPPSVSGTKPLPQKLLDEDIDFSSLFTAILGALSALGSLKDLVSGGRRGNRYTKPPNHLKRKLPPKKRIEQARKKATIAARKKGADKAAQKAAGEKAAAKAKERLAAKALQEANQKAAAEALKKVNKAAAAAVTKQAIEKAASKAVARNLAKATVKTIPVAGAVVGVGFAAWKLIQGDWVGAGVEAVSGLGSAMTSIPAAIYSAIRDTYEEVYGVLLESDPQRDERLQPIKDVVTAKAHELLSKKIEQQPPPPVLVFTPSTAGAGRGAINPQLVTPEPEVEQASVVLTSNETPVVDSSGQPVATGAVAVSKPRPATTSSVGELSPEDKPIMDMIEKHEGVVLRPYRDTKGLWTVGVGHLIGDGKSLPPEWDREFTQKEIRELFVKDYLHHKQLAARAPGWGFANEKGRAALIDLTFNMGLGWVSKFKKAVAALQQGDFITAAAEFRDSLWFTQVKGRAVTVTSMLQNGGDSSIAMKRSNSVGTQIASASVATTAAKADQKRGNDVTVVAVNEKRFERRPSSPAPHQRMLPAIT